MAPALIIVATLLILIVFVFLVKGPEDGFGFSVLLAIAALVISPLASRPHNKENRNLRRVSMVMWGLTFYCMYRAASEEDPGWGLLAFLFLLFAAAAAIAYLVVQNQNR